MKISLPWAEAKRAPSPLLFLQLSWWSFDTSPHINYAFHYSQHDGSHCINWHPFSLPSQPSHSRYLLSTPSREEWCETESQAVEICSWDSLLGIQGPHPHTARGLCLLQTWGAHLIPSTGAYQSSANVFQPG